MALIVSAGESPPERTSPHHHLEEDYSERKDVRR
jgi:hypothetical protein